MKVIFHHSWVIINRYSVWNINLFLSGIANGEKLIGMGWGQTATSNFSPVLKENLFTAISDSMCEGFYQTELDPSILCTRDVPGQSICQGNTHNHQ